MKKFGFKTTFGKGPKLEATYEYFSFCISEISYVEDFLQDGYEDTPLDTDAFMNIAGEYATIGVQVTFTAEDNDYRDLTTRQELEEAVQHYKYNFGEDDIEGFREDIKEIMLNFIKNEIETEGKGKIADVLKTIEGIEEDYKHFFAECLCHADGKEFFDARR